MENQFQVCMAKSPVTDIYYNMKFRKSRLICISIRIEHVWLIRYINSYFSLLMAGAPNDSFRKISVRKTI